MPLVSVSPPLFSNYKTPTSTNHPPATLATAFLLPQATPRLSSIRQKQALALFTISGAIFRSEIALLLATTALYLLLVGKATLRTIIPACLGSFIAALAVSVPIDSYFWQKPVWPELWGFYFNAVLGSSSEWGVSPWHWYFTSALPRLVLNPLVPLLVLYALSRPGTSRAAQALVVPNLAYVAIYSLQPHKEARFIFYVVPGLTAAAALGANYITIRFSKSIVYKATSGVLLLSILASFVASTLMLLLSSLNYPGGDALNQVYALATPDPSSSAITVHADVLACMTGLTLFGQNPTGQTVALNLPTSKDTPAHPRFIFDKTEKGPQLEWPQHWMKMDYVLAEDPGKVIGGSWESLGVVQGYDGIEVLKPGKEGSSVEDGERVLGLGARVASIRDFVRQYTGGWWIGPRMSPRIRILMQNRSTSHESVR